MLRPSNQLTIGKALSLLEAVGNDQLPVGFALGDLRPSDVFSYRGIYEDASISYTSKGTITVGEFSQMLQAAINEVHDGYKGGRYMFDEKTVLWADNWGEATRSAVVGVRAYSDRVVLVTEYCPLFD